MGVATQVAFSCLLFHLVCVPCPVSGAPTLSNGHPTSIKPLWKLPLSLTCTLSWPKVRGRHCQTLYSVECFQAHGRISA